MCEYICRNVNPATITQDMAAINRAASQVFISCWRRGSSAVALNNQALLSAELFQLGISYAIGNPSLIIKKAGILPYQLLRQTFYIDLVCAIGYLGANSLNSVLPDVRGIMRSCKRLCE